MTFMKAQIVEREKQLNHREMEISRLVAEGLTNTEIAEALYISPRTVSTHLEKIYRRLGINSGASLVKYLIDKGFSIFIRIKPGAAPPRPTPGKIIPFLGAYPTR